MRKKIVAVLLGAGLVAGLCGCGSISGDSLPEETVVEEAENDYSAEVVEEVEATEEPELENEKDEEPISQIDEESENTDVADNSSTLSLLTDYVIEVEDADGYQIRETIQVSPIFRENDMETVYALWEALGNDVVDFPSKDKLRNENHDLADYQLEYIVGTYMIENLTDGFSITSDNPRRYSRAFTAEGNSNSATFFNNRSVSAVAYSSGIKYYSDIFAVVIGEPKMTSDIWGPRTFMIALPNAYTPNQPDGYRYDEIKIIFSYNSYGSYDRSNYDSFELEYYTKEVE